MKDSFKIFCFVYTLDILALHKGNEYNQRDKCQQTLGSCSARFSSAVGSEKNQYKLHVQPCHFHCFL